MSMLFLYNVVLFLLLINWVFEFIFMGCEKLFLLVCIVLLVMVSNKLVVRGISGLYMI